MNGLVFIEAIPSLASNRQESLYDLAAANQNLSVSTAPSLANTARPSYIVTTLAPSLPLFARDMLIA
jgi:hypothetical protein